MLEKITEYAFSYKDSIKNDLARLIAIPSWEDKTTMSSSMPFGQGVNNAFEYVKELCICEKMVVSSVGGYAFHADWGENPPIGLATHLDTVQIHDIKQWSTPLSL